MYIFLYIIQNMCLSAKSSPLDQKNDALEEEYYTTVPNVIFHFKF